jgi:hypothetical protein
MSKMAAKARKRTGNGQNYLHQYQSDISDLEYLKSANEIRLQANMRIVLVGITMLTACGLAHIKRTHN